MNLAKWFWRLFKDEMLGPAVAGMPILGRVGKSSWLIGIVLMTIVMFREWNFHHLWMHFSIAVVPLGFIAILVSFFTPPPDHKDRERIKRNEAGNENGEDDEE